MSAIREAIERDQADLEPEEQDEDPGSPEPEPEPEPDTPLEGPEHEPEQPAPDTQAVLAKRTKALETETRRHENALRKAYGDDFDQLAVCPACLGDGWLIPAPPGAFPPEQWEAVQLACGQVLAAEYKTADYAEMCPTCDGWGQVLSGSKTEHGRLIVCRPCEGKGWKAKLDAPPPAPVFTLPAPPPANGVAAIDWTRPKDAWGRPEGHPHHGMDPALVGLTGS